MREQVGEFLKKTMPHIDFEASDHLVEDGILDSMTIIELVSELAIEYDIQFSMEELTPADFNSLSAIAETVERHIEKRQ